MGSNARPPTPEEVRAVDELQRVAKRHGRMMILAVFVPDEINEGVNFVQAATVSDIDRSGGFAVGLAMGTAVKTVEAWTAEIVAGLAAVPGAAVAFAEGLRLSFDNDGEGLVGGDGHTRIENLTKPTGDDADGTRF